MFVSSKELKTPLWRRCVASTLGQRRRSGSRTFLHANMQRAFNATGRQRTCSSLLTIYWAPPLSYAGLWPGGNQRDHTSRVHIQTWRDLCPEHAPPAAQHVLELVLYRMNYLFQLSLKIKMTPGCNSAWRCEQPLYVTIPKYDCTRWISQIITLSYLF